MKNKKWFICTKDNDYCIKGCNLMVTNDQYTTETEFDGILAINTKTEYGIKLNDLKGMDPIPINMLKRFDEYFTPITKIRLEKLKIIKKLSVFNT